MLKNTLFMDHLPFTRYDSPFATTILLYFVVLQMGQFQSVLHKGLMKH